jgi:hypothetical protein
VVQAVLEIVERGPHSLAVDTYDVV